jgi:hypothetical protein
MVALFLQRLFGYPIQEWHISGCTISKQDHQAIQKARSFLVVVEPERVIDAYYPGFRRVRTHLR